MKISINQIVRNFRRVVIHQISQLKRIKKSKSHMTLITPVGNMNIKGKRYQIQVHIVSNTDMWLSKDHSAVRDGQLIDRRKVNEEDYFDQN